MKAIKQLFKRLRHLNVEFFGDFGHFQVKIVYASNHGETLIIASAYFLTAIIKVFISGSKGTSLYIHPILTFY